MKKLTLILLLLASALVSSASNPSAKTEVSGWNHFAWGAEIGGAIDLTSHDMSTVNLNAYFGYRNSWLDLLGIGAEVDMMLSNSVRAFPVYAIVRTGFSSKPTLLFMDLRGGVVFNNLSNSKQQTKAYLSPGLGINLAGGRTFQSYITVSYVYNGMSEFSDGEEFYDVNGLSMACLRLGIRF